MTTIFRVVLPLEILTLKCTSCFILLFCFRISEFYRTGAFEPTFFRYTLKKSFINVGIFDYSIKVVEGKYLFLPACYDDDKHQSSLLYIFYHTKTNRCRNLGSIGMLTQYLKIAHHLFTNLLKYMYLTYLFQYHGICILLDLVKKIKL